jgi:S-disulfanyl-L-cysteine oxidoreductase SoxD
MKTTVAILMLAGVNAVAVAQAPRTTWSGVYTEAQAKRGAEVYSANCASCHGPDLGGVDSAPSLVGGEFNTNWNDLSLNDLMERIRATMPADKPGSVERQQIADIMAFMLGKANFPAGDAELPAQGEVLKDIKFLSAKPQ